MQVPAEFGIRQIIRKPDGRLADLPVRATTPAQAKQRIVGGQAPKVRAIAAFRRGRRPGIKPVSPVHMGAGGYIRPIRFTVNKQSY
jgi:hypothetical protein